MKTDHATLSTEKTLEEIVSIIKNVAQKYGAEIEKIEDDPFGNVGGIAPNVAVLLYAQVKALFMKGARCWGVQIYVTDIGSTREIEMVALGDGASQKYSGDFFFGLGDSISKRNEIFYMLRD